MKNKELILNYIEQINILLVNIDDYNFIGPNALKEQKEELTFRMIELAKILETDEIFKIKNYIYTRTKLMYPSIHEIAIKHNKNTFQRKVVLKKEEQLLLDKLMFLEVLSSIGLEQEYDIEVDLLYKLNVEVKHNLENDIKKKR
jgi:hypothetical protein